jgi:hypothetical protein
MLIILFLGSTLMIASTHKGVIFGAYVKYNSSTEITVTPGSGRCNDNFWSITSDTDVNLYSVLPTGEDFLYIYIDDSASSYPTPTIIGSTTEPTFSGTNNGWYNGNDRCIGVVWCDSYGNIVSFQNNSRNEYIQTSSGKQVLSGGNPSGAYQTLETTAYIPVNAAGVYLYAGNTDTNASVRVIVSAYENLYSSVHEDSSYGSAGAVGWISLERGWSRDLKWFGNNDDDNNYAIYLRGFRIER